MDARANHSLRMDSNVWTTSILAAISGAVASLSTLKVFQSRTDQRLQRLETQVAAMLTLQVETALHNGLNRELVDAIRKLASAP